MQCISNSELRLTCSEQELCTFMSVSNTVSAPADSSLKQPVYGTSYTLRKTDAVQHRFLTAESVLTIFGIKTSVLVVCSAAEQFQLPLELREKKIIKTLLVESVVSSLPLQAAVEGTPERTAEHKQIPSQRNQPSLSFQTRFGHIFLNSKTSIERDKSPHLNVPLETTDESLICHRTTSKGSHLGLNHTENVPTG